MSRVGRGRSSRAPVRSLAAGLAMLLALAAPARPAVRVLVVAGQSNAVGYGSSAAALPAPQQAPRGDIRFRFEEGPFSALADPSQRIRSGGFLPLAFQTDPGGATFGGLTQGFGPELQLGRQIADVTRDTVVVVKFAINATSLAVDWDPDTPGSLFSQMAAQVDTALADLAGAGLPARVRGFFWMQGEWDAQSAAWAAAYEANLADLVARVRSRFGEPALPFVLGRLNAAIDQSCCYSFPFLAQVRAAQAAVDANVPGTWMVDTDDLPLTSDLVHFTAAAQLRLGERFADAHLAADPAGFPQGASLRFHANGVGDIDRVKIRVDDPANALAGPPADIGATDFTIEAWLRALPGENPAPPVGCGANIDWIYGDIVLDRDRYNQDRKFGLSLAAGRPVFGVSGEGTGDRTLCGSTALDDGAWHHVAVQRRRSDGMLWLHVDGVLEASVDGPDGDVSYPDDGVPGDYCGGPCTSSDPFIVLGAEKHDAGPAYPSFSGWLDELRLSSTLRYAGAGFTPPSGPFTPDGQTVALYHLDEASGDDVADASGAAGGPSPGLRRPGGLPSGPLWSARTPFASPTVGVAPPAPAAGTRLRAWPVPSSGAVRFRLEGADPERRPARLCLYDLAGRRRVCLEPAERAGVFEFEWSSGTGADSPSPGVYFARVETGAGVERITIVVR